MPKIKTGIIGPHLVRYGTAADQHFLIGQFLNTYHQLILNANIVAHMPGALASLLSDRAKGKPYFIDPQTHAFQHDISHLESSSNEGEIKKSIKTLIDRYGEPIQSVVGKNKNSILPGDFNKPSVVRGFCERVINFQRNELDNQISQSDAKKYYDFLRARGKNIPNRLQPSIVIAPYFYMTPNTLQDWIGKNIECAMASQKIADNLNMPLGVQIVISLELLSSNKLRGNLISAYKKNIKPAAYLIWVDSLSEGQASKDELRALMDLFKQLGSNTEIVNLYGGFFSVALSRCGLIPNLKGISHGLEYGEDRGVIPVGGGIPTAKYYFPRLHTRLSFRDAFRAVRALQSEKSPVEFFKNVCDCKECKTVIKDNPENNFLEFGKTRPISFIRRNQPVGMEFPLPETRAHCVKHYMWRKEREYKEASSVNSVIKDLNDAKMKLERSLGLERVSHCGIWSEVLQQANEKG